MTNIVCISDTHTKLNEIDIPEGDLLIHSGDCSFGGTETEIKEFNNQLGKIKHKFKQGIIFVPGNHDWLYEKNEKLARELTSNATVLIDEFVVVDGIKIYGSPFQPEFCSWAFNLPRGKKLKEKWDKIPIDIDILVTHGPPYGIMDHVRPHPSNKGTHAGCEDLLEAVKRIKPRFHIFGHIHDSSGILDNGDTVFVNASNLDDNYLVEFNPYIVGLEKSK